MKTKIIIFTLLSMLVTAHQSSAQGYITAFQLTGSEDSFFGRPYGKTITVYPADGYTFTFNSIWVSGDQPLSSGTLEVDIMKASSYYALIISMPTTSTPTVGLYTDVGRWAFQDVGQAGMSFVANGSGYNNLDGWFNILEFQHSDDGKVISLAIDFYQHAKDYAVPMNPWEFGSIRYNSTVSITPVPEPQSLGLIAMGVVALIAVFRKK